MTTFAELALSRLVATTKTATTEEGTIASSPHRGLQIIRVNTGLQTSMPFLLRNMLWKTS